MKKLYYLPLLSYKEQVYYYYVLLDEIDRQNWYTLYMNRLTQKEEFISIQ
ncbi:MAG: hypothetical protein ACHQQQ_05450 [Bacteroidota bacterium]